MHQRAAALERRGECFASAGEETDQSGNVNDRSLDVSAPVDFVYERVVPRIFGYPVHETSQLMAWQDRQQKKQTATITNFRQQKLHSGDA